MIYIETNNFAKNKKIQLQYLNSYIELYLILYLKIN
jgi:hypothetical protein